MIGRMRDGKPPWHPDHGHAHHEHLADLNSMVFDGTGTLTTGELTVTSLLAAPAGMTNLLQTRVFWFFFSKKNSLAFACAA